MSRSGRYLDPIASGDPIHDSGEGKHFFGKLDVVPASGVDIDIIGGYNATLYDVPNGPVGLFATHGGRLDSGLPFDLTDRDGNGLDPEASRAELRRRGYSDDVIDLLSLESERPGSPDKAVAPHATFDVAAGIDL